MGIRIARGYRIVCLPCAGTIFYAGHPDLDGCTCLRRKDADGRTRRGARSWYTLSAGGSGPCGREIILWEFSHKKMNHTLQFARQRRNCTFKWTLPNGTLWKTIQGLRNYGLRKSSAFTFFMLTAVYRHSQKCYSIWKNVQPSTKKSKWGMSDCLTYDSGLSLNKKRCTSFEIRSHSRRTTPTKQPRLFLYPIFKRKRRHNFKQTCSSNIGWIVFWWWA